MERSRSAPLLPIALLALAACEAPDQSVGETDGDLFVPPNARLWNDNRLGAHATIAVCFSIAPRIDANGETQCPSELDRTRDCLGDVMPTQQLREMVRTAAEDTWMRAADIEFVGWGDCPATNSLHQDSALPHQIVIQFSHVQNVKDPPPVDWSGVGKSNTGPTVIQYNWPALMAGTDRFNLIHEVGHALGFSHEDVRHNWVGARCGKDTDLDPNQTGILLNPGPSPDLASVMNYCPKASSTDGRLSPGDVMGLRRAYGRKPDHSIVGYRGNCLDAQGAATAAGTPIIAYPCRGQRNDTWLPSSQLLSDGDGMCLNVQGGTAPNPLILWSCGAFDNERFTRLGVEWRAMGNMCVQAVSKRLQVRACDGSAAQKWDFFQSDGTLSPDQIRQSGTNLCVAAKNNAVALGDELVLATCAEIPLKQRFSMPGNGLLVTQLNARFCASVFGGLPISGSKLVLWDGCTPANPPPNSQFTISGAIESLGHCVDIAADGASGNVIRAEPCAQAMAQVWEYFL
jgi:hypothetical protein